MEQFVIIVRTLTTVSQRDKAGLLDPPLPGMTLLDIIFLSKGYWPFLLLDSVNELNSIKTFPLRESEFFWSVFSCIQTEYGEILCIFFFFYQGFLLQTLTTHRATGEGRGPSFIPLYHFQPLTNIQTFICNFACETTITYF